MIRILCGLWVIGAVAGAAGVAGAAAPAAAVEGYLEGNRRYQDGDFGGAVEAYEGVLALGLTAPELEFNLGNAYLKSDQLGRAILHYRRALLLSPGHESAMENIKYARSLTLDVKPEETPRMRWAAVTSFRLGPTAAAFSLFLSLTAFLAVAGLRLGPWRGRRWATAIQSVVGGLGLLVATAVVFEWGQLEGHHGGVVIAEGIDVRSGPGESYTVSFRLHEGTEVEVLRESAGWREIRVSDRLQGWTPEVSVEEI